MNQPSTRVERVAARLRLALADQAGQNAEIRRDHLDEIIARELVGLSGEERGVFLNALADKFPAQRRETVGKPEAPVAAELAERIRIFAREDKQKIHPSQEEEPAAGASVDSAELERALRDFREHLDLERIELSRLVELSECLISFAGRLEQVAWSTWRTLAPDSPLKRSAKLSEAVKSFLNEEEGASLDSIRQYLDTLCKLLTALTAALGHMTHNLAYEHFARIAPAEIENLVGVEGGGFLTSRDVKCWRKYVELAATFDEARLERDIKGRTARYVESLMKVAGR